jgi:hypothetical protein
MARKDKILDILSLAQLSDEAKVARLAHRWVGKSMSVSQAQAIAEVYFGFGQRREMTRRLFDEHVKQQRLRNSRQAFATAAAERAKSPMLRFKGAGGAARRKQRIMEIAQRTFGQHVRDNFNEDTLALMSLISGENRSYEIKWLDAGFSPVRCALIEVITRGRVNPCQTNVIHARFLLYKAGRRVLVARVLPKSANDVENAWGSQLPKAFMEKAGQYHAEGCSFQMDYEGQEMVVTAPDGSVIRVPWTGRTADV